MVLLAKLQDASLFCHIAVTSNKEISCLKKKKKTNKQAVFANRDGMLKHPWNRFLPVLFVDHLFPSIGV